MWGVIGALLIVWLLITVVSAIFSAVIHGLFWLAVIGGLLFVGTAIYGWTKKQINK
jgi:hypothetical protein